MSYIQPLYSDSPKTLPFSDQVANSIKVGDQLEWNVYYKKFSIPFLEVKHKLSSFNNEPELVLFRTFFGTVLIWIASKRANEILDEFNNRLDWQFLIRSNDIGNISIDNLKQFEQSLTQDQKRTLYELIKDIFGIVPDLHEGDQLWTGKPSVQSRIPAYERRNFFTSVR